MIRLNLGLGPLKPRNFAMTLRSAGVFSMTAVAYYVSFGLAKPVDVGALQRQAQRPLPRF